PDSRLHFPNPISEAAPPTSRTNSTGSSVTSEVLAIHLCFIPAANSTRLRSNTKRSANSTHRASGASGASGKVVEIDLRTTSRPIPAGSPAVIPIVGRMRETGKMRLVDVLVLVFLIHVLDVML